MRPSYTIILPSLLSQELPQTNSEAQKRRILRRCCEICGLGTIAIFNTNDAAMKVAEGQAVSNAKSIAATIEPFYGVAAKEVFFKLLAGHYGAVKAYLVATASGDASAQANATQSLTSNAEEIAVFLSKANPYLQKDALHSLLLAHGGHHIRQIQELKDRKYDAEAKTWEDMKNHIYQIADATADALAKQFTKEFS